jgi:hypothetical protein
LSVRQVPLQLVVPLAQPQELAGCPSVAGKVTAIVPLAVLLSQLFALMTFTV